MNDRLTIAAQVLAGIYASGYNPGTDNAQHQALLKLCLIDADDLIALDKAEHPSGPMAHHKHTARELEDGENATCWAEGCDRPATHMRPPKHSANYFSYWCPEHYDATDDRGPPP